MPPRSPPTHLCATCQPGACARPTPRAPLHPLRLHSCTYPCPPVGTAASRSPPPPPPPAARSPLRCGRRPPPPRAAPPPAARRRGRAGRAHGSAGPQSHVSPVACTCCAVVEHERPGMGCVSKGFRHSADQHCRACPAPAQRAHPPSTPSAPRPPRPPCRLPSVSSPPQPRCWPAGGLTGSCGMCGARHAPLLMTRKSLVRRCRRAGSSRSLHTITQRPSSPTCTGR